MNAKIDPLNGEFIVGEHRFSPQLNEAEYLGSDTAKSSRKVRSSSSRNYYEIWQRLSSKLEVGLTLGFACGGPLLRISAKFVRVGLRESGASVWSKALEGEIEGFHDAWLKEQLGKPPYQFTWGKVMSIIEPHWYSANIVIDYTRKKDPSLRAVGHLRKK